MKVNTLMELLREYQDYTINIDSPNREEERYTTPFKIVVNDKTKIVYIKCQVI